MALSLTFVSLIGSLVIGAVAIAVLARKLALGRWAQSSGFLCAALGAFVFFNARNILPHTPTHYESMLAFGIGYGGQALIFLLLAIKCR